MWVLALAGVFLAVAKACIFCRLPTHALPSRLARLSSQMEMQWKEWASPDFSAFALDEVTMNKITEKTHRVLKVMEIKRSFSSLPSYWQWLQKTKIPQYTREATPLGPSFQLSVLPPAGAAPSCTTAPPARARRRRVGPESAAFQEVTICGTLRFCSYLSPGLSCFWVL
ncbi:sperm-egg fusion protein TMEM95 isoform X4 [Peromyscus eremicus]|uniref:sperm-egg fusion protein TMEM95 isoform X4 n=1 Tax=Peromyscus eremicus TaxID=42410 RepID=UPI0027DBC30E|nr:sperm-egg fusion protein TMEM95 isoform X4 [Peromyscus eremicus]